MANRLAMYSDVPLKVGESVIFIDEIQQYPEIVTKIKFLTDKGKYRFVFSGSNLGVELKGIKSMPVGYVEMFQMYPMDFREFAIASGIIDAMLQHMRRSYDDLSPVDAIVHDKLIKTFYYYLIVGGMPAVVNVYHETHSLEAVTHEQESIINQYKADFIKYEAVNKRLRIISIYDNIPAQLNKQNRKFRFTLLDKELKFDRYEDSFLWLKDAGVAIPAYIAGVPHSPLEMSKETNVFKLYMSDVGLLTSCYPMSVKKDLLEMNPNRDINNGSLFENFVAQEIVANDRLPYYYKKTNVGEIDFLIEGDNGALPVEVKSGADYKKHAALNNLMNKHELKSAYVVSTNNVEMEDGIIYLPIYMISLICEARTQDYIME